MSSNNSNRLGSQFQTRYTSTRGGGPAVVVTVSTVPSDGTNLTLECVRIVMVGDPHRYSLRYPRRGQQYDWLFSVLLAGREGLLDATCYTGSLRERFVANFGQLVTLHGASSRPMTAEQLQYAHGLGDNQLCLSLPAFRMEPLPASMEASCGIPPEGRIPPTWIRVHDEDTAGRESRSMEHTPLRAALAPSQAVSPPIRTTSAQCCSDPSGPMCRRTGRPHPRVCIACCREVREDEPFCSVRPGLACIVAPCDEEVVMTSVLSVGSTVAPVPAPPVAPVAAPRAAGPVVPALLQDAMKRVREHEDSTDDEKA